MREIRSMGRRPPMGETSLIFDSAIDGGWKDERFGAGFGQIMGIQF